MIGITIRVSLFSTLKQWHIADTYFHACTFTYILITRGQGGGGVCLACMLMLMAGGSGGSGGVSATTPSPRN